MVGLVVFANNSGLGAQTRRLAEMLKPVKVLIVDASYFSQNKEQHFEWYKDYPSVISKGFPSNDDVLEFLEDLEVVLTCENPFNFNLVYWAQQKGIRVYCQANYEFCENLSKPYLPVPDKFLMPSYWKIQDMEDRFGKDRVMYLPPPINSDEFKKVREFNLKKKGHPKFLHIVGTGAYKDRNGTLDLLKAVKLANFDFKLVIKTQHPLEMEYKIDDPRIEYELTEAQTNAELYKGFDALILPRRYGGLSLTTNEALMSGIPVIMTDISPNNQLLPKEWLAPAKRIDYFNSRSLIAIYSVDPQALATIMDRFCLSMHLQWKRREQAIEIAMQNFDMARLKLKYLELFNNG